MRKITVTAFAVIFLVLLLLAGCAQIVPAAASVQQSGVLAQATLAASPSISAQPSQSPSAQPSVSASQTPAESASASASAASASPTQSAAYKVAVPYDLVQEKNSQKSVDAGHSPWRLDAIASVQSFVSIKMSPNGQVVGDFPIKEEDLRVTQMSNTDAVVTVNNDKSPISTVYLKRLVKQDETGIWTVVGYDPK